MRQSSMPKSTRKVILATKTQIDEEIPTPQAASEEEHALSTPPPPITADLEEVSPRGKQRKLSSGLPTADESVQEVTGVNAIGKTWAQIIDGIFEARRACQENANDLMHTQLKKRKVLDEKIIEKGVRLLT